MVWCCDMVMVAWCCGGLVLWLFSVIVLLCRVQESLMTVLRNGKQLTLHVTKLHRDLFVQSLAALLTVASS